jgi:hypothetical protein
MCVIRWYLDFSYAEIEFKNKVKTEYLVHGFFGKFRWMDSC